MKRTVQRYDIAFKVSKENKSVIEDAIAKAEKKHGITLHATIRRDSADKGFLVTCIQGLHIPQYKVNDAVLDLTTIVRAVCKLQTAIINKSNCLLDDCNEDVDISVQQRRSMDNLIVMGEQDNLFDCKAYANDIPPMKVVEAMEHVHESNTYYDDFLNDEAMTKRSYVEVEKEIRSNKRKEKCYGN